ncbi:DPP IV N-terminal domain-containing protein [Sphingomonas sp. KR1UV-12]|uniref:DPP IV N-terminal domain-containing protein n=1 Tax=Sphingomonas aurea TaxID=3063994 RepID=A0ABT9ELV9_9SPHN|nr:S9 family peptidase [Sphingomonas sp. KR1UV-12]MDP1027947.1 DPP IV N-terminal domain-containing protein [Sphingomonas sp. KR1UV-12]
MKRALALALLALPQIAPAQGPTVADRIQRSIDLREQWQWLTRDIATPPTWDEDGRHFHYRKTVEGGYAFVDVARDGGDKRPAFDAGVVARALAALTGKPVDPLRLPFEAFDYADGRGAIVAQIDDDTVRCTLVQTVCTVVPPEHPSRPRGFGVVRDLRVPAENHPRPSPDGRLEALVLDDNLVVRVAGGGREAWRSQDGSPADFYDPETIAWAPDGRRVIAYRVRPGYARMVTRVVAAPPGKVQPEVVQQLYPKPGDAVDQERPVLFAVADGRRIAIADTLFPNPYYLSEATWRKDGKSVAFDYLRRGFGEARTIAVDADTGAAHVAVGEDPATFVFRDRIFGHDVGGLGREIVWASERDGWRHLYLVDATTGRIKRQITKGEWIVRDIAKVDDEKRQIWFSAGGYVPGEDPYYKQWFRVDFDGRNLVRLTKENATHELRFSPDMSRYVDVYSRTDLPETTELHDARDGRLIATLEKGDITRLTAAGFRPPERFTAKGRDGRTDIYGVVVRPRDFDPAKRYPVIENIYAGPHDSFVPKAFWPFGGFSGGDKVMGMQQLADLGFVVVQIDGMGTANRSKAFHDVAWKHMEDMGFPDRIAWMKALAAKDPAVDLSRVGIYGGSAGGQNTLNALLFHPDFYKAGIAYAGCFDNRMDKIDWNEQWLGWPVDQSYLNASGVVHAGKLQGKLMLVVGEQDSNVDPASTMQVVDALIRADKTFDLLVIPNGEHSAGRTTGPVPYAMRRHYDFFLRALRGEGVADWNAR